jgi:hypothetical protein
MRCVTASRQTHQWHAFMVVEMPEAANFASGGHVAATFPCGKPASVPENFVAVAVSAQ